MASVQVKASTGSTDASKPKNAVSTTIILSEKTKIIAHPGDKWKAGYATISRVSLNKSGWRHVHISKRSFEKFAENIQHISDAFDKKIQVQVMLNKKQHILTTKFARGEKEALYYVSVLHPTNECETLSEGDEVNHSKTINLSPEEFAKIKNEMTNLLEVVRSKSIIDEHEESKVIEGFRWTLKETGRRSGNVFLTREQCSRDADFDYLSQNKEQFQGQPMEYDYESHYEFHQVQVDRPSKLDLIEHMVYASIASILQRSGIDINHLPPSSNQLRDAMEKFDKYLLVNIVKRTLILLKYKNAFMAQEFVDIFLFMKGFDRVKEVFLQHKISPSGQFFPRLLNFCFDHIHDQIIAQ